MDLIRKIAEQEHIGGVPVDNIKRIASSRLMSQEQFAEYIGVSLSSLRQKLRDKKIKWKNQNGRLIRRKNIDKVGIEEKRNTSWYNPALNTRVRHQFSSGYYNLR